jgi:NAD(P)-dependent dehydrogenase (short-subunit alcohol dehydrogenase family)
VITGGSEGIGLETAKLLARDNAKNIIIASRNEDKARKAILEIEKLGT